MQSEPTKPIVYVREVSPATLIAEGVMPHNTAVPQGVKLYAVHLENGERIAVMDDRQRAFVLAMQNDLEPVSVH
jgi:hypothetical protein